MGLRRLLVADLDGTLLGDDDALGRFAAWIATRRPDLILVYATGRSRESIDGLVRHTVLPAPDVSITQVGTEIHDERGRPWPGWDDRFDGWDAELARRALVVEPSLQLQPARFQTPRKASFFAAGLSAADVERMQERVAAAGLRARLVYSGNWYLDVLPPGAGKGEAVLAVAESMRVAPEQVLVFGDTGNDVDLFHHGFQGTVVGNALPELRLAAPDAYHARGRHADGVLEGLAHWWPDADASAT